MFDRARAWLWWRIPRLFMNRTAYAFWVMGERQKLQRRMRLEQSQARPAPNPED